MNATQWFTKKNGLTLTGRFGPRIHPITKKAGHHAGIDYGGKKGTPIYTPVGGTVTHSKHYPGYGNLVAVQDPAGQRHLFAHLDSRLVKKGDKVRRGDVVGKLGSTGASTGPHLHYQINKPSGGINGGGYWGDPDKYVFEEARTVEFVLVNSWADVPYAKRLMERKNCYMAWRNDNGQLVGDLSRARKIYVCGGRTDDIPKGPEIVNLAGADAFVTVANIGEAIKKNK